MSAPHYRQSVAELLSTGRAADLTVAHTEEGPLTWSAFHAQVVRQASEWQGPTRRILLTSADPTTFASTLLAAIACGHAAIIPPNFQPGTLAERQAHLASDTCPPLANSIELYTSGSSGQPKRIVKTLRQLEAECQALEAFWGKALGASAIIATVPLHHIYGLLFRLLWPLLAARPFDAITCSEPNTLAERLALLGDGVLVASPAHLERLPALTDLARYTAKPRHVFSSGGPLSAATAAAFHTAWGCAPTEVFGSTETGGIAWRVRHPAASEQDAWTPMPEVDITLAPDSALQIRSPFLPSPDPWRMDDAATLLPDGRFLLSGRLDRTVKIEEKRLALPEMEARLSTHPFVGKAAVTPFAASHRTRIGAVIVPSEAGISAHEADRKALSTALRKHLAAWYDPILLPRHWRFVDALPYDERGKLQHTALACLFEKNDPAA